MISFTSVADMLNNYLKNEWTKELIDYGFLMVPPQKIGKGKINVYGDIESCCFISSDIVFFEDQMERFYVKQRSIQMSFVEDMNMNFYQNKAETYDSNFGTFFYFNNEPRPWFHKTPANMLQKVVTLYIQETFFKDNGIAFPEYLWVEGSRMFNMNSVSIPSIAYIFQQIKNTSVNEVVFPMFFRAKCLEAVSILLDYLINHSDKKNTKLSVSHYQCVEKAKKIIQKDIICPPTIEHLSHLIGVDKKKLQTGFQNIVGQTVAEYIRCVRMEHALYMLENDDFTIDKIAQLVGYQSKINFYKAFEKSFKMTPNEMRKMLGKNSKV